MSLAYHPRPWLWGLLTLAALTTGCATDGWDFGKLNAFRQDDDPRNFPRTRLAYAQVQEQAGNMTEARKIYGDVLDQDPRSVDAVLGLARLDDLAQRTKEAEAGYLKAARLAPNSAHVQNAVGQYYAQHERWEESIACLRAAANAAPDEKAYRFHLAVALARSGAPDEAILHFSHAVGEAQAHYNLGRLYYDQGQAKEAEEQFLIATVKNPKLEEAQLWLDEVRKEREAQVALSAGQANPAAPKTPAPQQAAPAVPTAGPPAGPAGALPAPSYAQQPAGPYQSSEPVRGVNYESAPQAPAAPRTGIPEWKARGTATQTVETYPSDPPADAAIPQLTPAQLEQLRNQSQPR